MAYRVGLPFWKTVARAGNPVTLRVDMMRDEEAGVYVAHSPDLDGLLVEAATLDELRAEAMSAAEVLLTLALRTEHVQRAKADFRFTAALPCGA